MKIAHLCLSCFYIDDRSYQENELTEEHVRQGHKVLVIASTHVHGAEGERTYTEPKRYVNGHGVEVVRIGYHPLIPLRLAKSIRVHKGVYGLLKEFRPDVILFHGMCGWELTTAAKYKRDNPSTLLYVDNHTDFINSARTFISKWVLHYCFYRRIVLKNLGYIEKVLCISKLTERFAREFYGIPYEKIEFYPLGGHIVPDGKYQSVRKKIRRDLGVTENEVVFVQSGKQSSQKKIIETLNAFTGNKTPFFRLYIVGALLSDVEVEARNLIDSDDRVCFLGWKRPEELKDLLCATDVYMQPGSQSSTMQTSLCCYCVPVLADIEGHEIYAKKNGWLVNNEKDIQSILKDISEGNVSLEDMKNESKKIATEMLDYSVLAQRILS